MSRTSAGSRAPIECRDSSCAERRSPGTRRKRRRREGGERRERTRGKQHAAAEAAGGAGEGGLYVKERAGKVLYLVLLSNL